VGGKIDTDTFNGRHTRIVSENRAVYKIITKIQDQTDHRWCNIMWLKRLRL